MYQKISLWALVRDDKNELHYLYRSGLHQEYLLSIELEHYQRCFTTI